MFRNLNRALSCLSLLALTACGDATVHPGEVPSANPVAAAECQSDFDQDGICDRFDRCPYAFDPLLRLGVQGTQLVQYDQAGAVSRIIADTGVVLSALAYDVRTNTLYAMHDAQAPRLATLDASSGEVVDIGPIRSAARPDRLAFDDESGLLYAGAGDQWLRLDPASAWADPVDDLSLEADRPTFVVAALNDADGDGAPHCEDSCPSDPDKTEPGQCGCGEADIDSDGDGRADCVDLCVQDLEKTELGACGCGQADIDSDGDCTPDCLDACPEDPDKIEQGQCGCGQPDTDSDGDGIADCIDTCADDPSPEAECECECTEDTDGDEAPDCLDACPEDPNKVSTGQCGCGVPDVDRDGDGVADCVDFCADDPDKVSMGLCPCGVPDIDADGDGVADCVDACSDDPDKVSTGQCGCGVPDVDTDGDGTADCIDACPENPNKTSTQGCGCEDE